MGRWVIFGQQASADTGKNYGAFERAARATICYERPSATIQPSILIDFLQNKYRIHT